AHQLGTPISSLREWINILRETNGQNQEETLSEIDRDIKRLELITERFSKIGSEPLLKPENLDLVIEKSIQYLRSRVSERVAFEITMQQPGNWAMLNVPLFEWVLENVCKNAIDAMTGEGHIGIHISKDPRHVYVDISDTGKGIAKSKFKTVFKPGFTTKK